ncbi:MAG TPA: A24 family peptidase [Bacillota bacterium]|nr:A24 family peptidase [Bacillota bacterium]HPL54090.1 A24 family peptidase [Bacillota bacterium]
MGNDFLYNNARMISYFAVILLLTAASIVDIREHRIPDKLVLTGAIAGLILSSAGPPGGLLNSFVGGTSAVIIFLLIYCITRGGIGFGDVKLFGCTGVYLGLENVVSVMLIATVLSGLYGIVLICINRDNKGRELPFAPFILIGTLVVIVF